MGEARIGTGSALKVTFGVAHAGPPPAARAARAARSATVSVAAEPRASLVKVPAPAPDNTGAGPRRRQLGVGDASVTLGVADRPREPLDELGGGVISAQMHRADVLVEEDRRGSGTPVGVGRDDDPRHG